MIKRYEIMDDDFSTSILKLKLNDKKKKILAGESYLMIQHDLFELWKVKVPYEIKVVGFIKKEVGKLKVFESIAISPTSDELDKMIINFNNFLKDEGLEHLSIKDKNRY